VLNTPSCSGQARARKSWFFYVHSFYGRVARKPKNSRKAKAQGRLQAVLKYLAALSTGAIIQRYL